MLLSFIHLSILSLFNVMFMIITTNVMLNPLKPIKITLNHGGSVIGKEETVQIDGKEVQVNSFLGIPYASKPIDKLRFAPPVKHPGWKGSYNATKLSATCWQYIFVGFDAVNAAGKMWINNTEMSEDCLYLNVWTPKPSAKNSRFPVMVWIYGGGFTSGSANLQVYNGAILSATQNVIIVSMQYRVGAFGFLRLKPNTTDQTQTSALGNQGLLDQLMALKWVKENIEQFHGDPNQVTIFGESAGAVSVSILWMSPIAQPYFRRAILQSGSLYARWGLDTADEAHEKADIFTQECGCQSPSVDRKASLECLRKLDPLTLVNQLDSINVAIGKRRYDTVQKYLRPKNHQHEPFLLSQSTSTRLYFDVPLQPVIDGHLMPKHPDQIFHNKNALKDKPELLIGVNTNEAMFFLLPGISIKDTQFLFPNGSVIMPDTIGLAGKKEPYKQGEEIADFYWITATQIIEESHMRPGLAKLPSYYYNLPLISSPKQGYYDPDTIHIKDEELLRRLDKFAGDLDFACPTLNFAEQVARLPDAKVFLYHFNKRTESLPMPTWTGVMHGYEIEYIFGIPHDPEFSKQFYNFTDPEKKFSSRMMEMWTNFAKTGHPSKSDDGHVSIPEWPLFRRTDGFISSDPDHLILENETKLGSGLHRDRCAFWLHEMKDMTDILNDTCECSSGIKPTGSYLLIIGLWLLLFIGYL
ncbi:unnamed protein product [Schistosoma intercalatum]|nr:unnamed protein product [Schistosoma intercalatum]CAH8486804.1 unnamed protein product [Schistosoma intercalatum]